MWCWRNIDFFKSDDKIDETVSLSKKYRSIDINYELFLHGSSTVFVKFEKINSMDCNEFTVK